MAQPKPLRRPRGPIQALRAKETTSTVGDSNRADLQWDEIVFEGPGIRHHLRFQRGRSPILDELLRKARNRHSTFSIVESEKRFDPVIDDRSLIIGGQTTPSGIGMTQRSLDEGDLKTIVHELVHRVDQQSARGALAAKLVSGEIEVEAFINAGLAIEKQAVEESTRAIIEYQHSDSWANLLKSEAKDRVEQRFKRECWRELYEPDRDGESGVNVWARNYRDEWQKHFGSALPPSR